MDETIPGKPSSYRTLTQVMRNKAKKKSEFRSTHFPIYESCDSLWEILSRILMKGSHDFRKTNKL